MGSLSAVAKNEDGKFLDMAHMEVGVYVLLLEAGWACNLLVAGGILH